MNDVVRFDLENGKEVAVTGHVFRQYGLQAVMDYIRASGIDLPAPKPVPVFQHGQQIGTLTSLLGPMDTPSRSVFHSVRPGDWVRSDRGWEAHRSLGPGDLSATPGFVWTDDPERSERDVQYDRQTALDALCAQVDEHPQGETAAGG